MNVVGERGQASGSNLPPPASVAEATERLRQSRVLLFGVGNVGSFAAEFLASGVSFLRIVDRDIVEFHNTANQLYSPGDVGRPKVEAIAERLHHVAPNLQVDPVRADVEDVPWEDFADVNLALGALDSLRARQVVSERLYPLQIPYIDGAVGDPLYSRVQVLLPGEACLECSWGPSHYRQIAIEYPCRPGTPTDAPPTAAPGCAGAVTAGVMIAQCLQLLTKNPPRESYEINGDCAVGKSVRSRRRRNPRCRFRHDVVPRTVYLPKAFADATITDLVQAIRHVVASQDVRLELRRGILNDELFGSSRYTALSQLERLEDQPLADWGFSPRDRIVIRTPDPKEALHLCLSHSEASRRQP